MKHLQLIPRSLEASEDVVSVRFGLFSDSFIHREVER